MSFQDRAARTNGHEDGGREGRAMAEQLPRRLTISVVMGTYNGRKYVESQIKSILAQTCVPDEIIISDDNSTDDTLDVIRNINVGGKTKVTLIENVENVGFGANFLRAAQAASGDVLAFCDQDDVWREDKLERCARPFADDGVVLVAHAARLIDADGAVIGHFPQSITAREVFEPLRFDPWGGYFGFSLAIRRELLGLIHWSNFRLDYAGARHHAHDRWIMLLALTSGRIVTIDEELVDYRQHGQNVYGATSQRAARLSYDDIVANADRRIAAARQMHALLAGVPPDVPGLPLFDKERALAWWQRIARRQERRHAAYVNPRRSGALAAVAANAFAGVYVKPQNDRLGARELAKDLYFLLFLWRAPAG